ncbi:MAG: class B sortase [Erysipelotrichaceae bacterium]|nr:class B sortase [Erysipelotrichaceae bacterium]
MNKDSKKKIILIVGAVMLALALALGIMISRSYSANEDESDNVPDDTQIITPDQHEQELLQYKEEWTALHNINNDYIGDIIFDSGLLRVSFVQAKSVFKEDGEMYKFYTENGSLVTDPSGYTGNDVYIWTYWKTGEYDYNDHGGSTFMDYRNEINDQNLIIYGHHFSVWNDETRQKAFTPLERLLEEENYQNNRYVTLLLANEVRKYELVAVYNFDATDDYYYENMQYWRTSYNYDDYTDTVDDSYYDRYIDAVKQHALYPTGVELSNTDKTLTLQTCISGHTGELFEILVLKEISSEPY